MALSRQAFKAKFKEDLLAVHWRQWSALGVASHLAPEDHWLIDLESLLVSTWVLGLQDKRLFGASLEWLTKNAEWVSVSRLKGVAKAFSVTPFPQAPKALFHGSLLARIGEALPQLKKLPLSLRNASSHGEELWGDYDNALRAFRVRGIAKPLEALSFPPLLQVDLRALWGADARVEVLLFLLFREGGNSLSLAREVNYDQKAVYRLLERWAKAGVVEKREGKYVLMDKAKWARFLGLDLKRYGYLNWTRTFLFLDRLARMLVTPPWSEDDYLLSSGFRDLEKEAKRVGRDLDVPIPEPAAYPGGRYFEPFASAVVEMLSRILAEGRRMKRS